MSDTNYLNFDEVKSIKKLDFLGKILFKDAPCNTISAEVFQRYTDILINKHPSIKGSDYDSLILEFHNLQKRIKNLHSSEDEEALNNFNFFAQEQCKILYAEFFDKPYHPEL